MPARMRPPPPASVWGPLLLLCLCAATADEPGPVPCADLARHAERVEGDFSGVSAGAAGLLDPAGEECDPEEDALFSRSKTSGDAGPGEAFEDAARGDAWEEADGRAGGDGRGGRGGRVGEVDPDATAPAGGRTAFTAVMVSGAASTGFRRILRHRAAQGDWSHAVEWRGDSLTRRRLVWHRRAAGGPAWRVAVGDMTDTALRLWPRGIPRRALPAGWTPARGMPEAPEAWSAPVPQGVAAGLFHTGGSVYAVRVWNPVATAGDRPWDPAWDLHLEGASVLLPLFRPDDAGHASPWRLLLHASATRIVRGPEQVSPVGAMSPDAALPSARAASTGPGTGAQPLAERLWATELSSPARGLTLTAALTENDRVRPGPAARGGLLGVVLRAGTARTATGRSRRRAAALDLELTARQRSAGWVSAWDPALTASLLEELRKGAAAAPDVPPGAGHPGGAGASEDPERLEGWIEEGEAAGGGEAAGSPAAAEARPSAPAWGAGEVRAGGRWTAPRSDTDRRYAPAGTLPSGLSLELWRAWNPWVGTARQGVRGAAEWRLEEARLTLGATQRGTRAASGTRSVYRFMQADARMTRFPHARFTTWRAWNAEGPVRTGLFLGAAPSWTVARTTWTVAPGLRLELNTATVPEEWTTQARLGVRVRRRTWALEALADAPLRPRGPDLTRGRIALSATRSVTR